MNPIPVTAAVIRPIGGGSTIDLTTFASRIEPAVEPTTYIPWAERPKFTWEEAMQIGRARNTALWDAEHDPGIDGAGLTTAEVSAWVRQAEADAIKAVFEAREVEAARLVQQEYRPTANDTVEISPEADAEFTGFSVGSQGIAARPPASYGPELRAAFERGYADGFRMYEEAEMATWPTEEEDRVVEIHFAELVEGAGVDFARNFTR